MKPTCLLVLAVCTACGGGSLTAQVAQQAANQRLGRDATEDLQDGLHLTLCGAGGPMPASDASGPCVLVVAGQRLFLVDAGTGGGRNLARMGYPIGRIEAVLLTHFHSDHLDGLGEVATLRWLAVANTAPLPVHGPPGVTEVVEGYNRVYRLDTTYRQAHHGDTVAPMSGAGMVPRPFEPPAMGALHTVLDEGDLKVEALRVDHDPADPAVGYRFTYKGRSLLISGDTAKHANVQRFAAGVDLLVHDALSPTLVGMIGSAATTNGNAALAKVALDIPDYHASPREAAEIARDAGVGHLLYYHVTPPIIAPAQRSLFLEGAQDVFGAYTIGQDGTSFSLPAGSKAITRTADGL